MLVYAFRLPSIYFMHLGVQLQSSNNFLKDGMHLAYVILSAGMFVILSGK